MRLPRRWVPLILGALSSGVLLAPLHASATTGPSDFLPASKYKVAAPVRAEYIGQYVFVSAAQGAK